MVGEVARGADACGSIEMPKRLRTLGPSFQPVREVKRRVHEWRRDVERGVDKCDGRRRAQRRSSIAPHGAAQMALVLV
jgi:hypothetical protein